MIDRANRRWLNWRAPGQIMADSTKGEPTKPSKPGSVGFEGSLLGVPANMDALHDAAASPGEGDREVPGLPDAGLPVPQNRLQSEVDSITQTERVMSWADWKAGALNRLFLEQGATGQSGRISAETVRHGERMKQNVISTNSVQAEGGLGRTER